MRKRTHFLLSTVVSGSLVLWAAGIEAASFQGLGDLPGGEFVSVAHDVSADGSTVVGSSRSDALSHQEEAFLWTADGGMIGLGYLADGTFKSRAHAVSADGSVVVGDSNRAGTQLHEAFRWTRETGMVGVGALPGLEYLSYGYGVSADGSVVVGWSLDHSKIRAFRWTAEEGMVNLGTMPGGQGSDAKGVSADGLVVVGRADPPEHGQAYRLTPEDGMVGLGVLPGGESGEARAASADGSVVVGISGLSAGAEAFRWTAETGMVGLGFLPDGPWQSWANDVSADGSVIVGGNRSILSDTQAIIWDETHGMRSLQDLLSDDFGLDLTGWSLEEATGVSDDGLVIVGNGINPAGHTEAWRAVIPEPSTLITLSTLLPILLLAAIRRRRQR